MRTSFASWSLALFLLFACSVEAQSARCAHCGMRVDPSGAFTAGALEDGHPIAFDSNKCLLRYRLEHAAIQSPWVTDYYARTHLPLDQAFFVLGSDVHGPMGPDAVALSSGADAARFTHDHHGTATHPFSEMTAEVVRSLFVH